MKADALPQLCHLIMTHCSMDIHVIILETSSLQSYHASVEHGSSAVERRTRNRGSPD